MSNFSQFFPAGSSGGSGGGINSYAPFLVTVTSNPTGYDATTGLYTHPDGTFWLKSGFTLNSSAYPDAKGGSQPQYTKAASQIPQPAGMTAIEDCAYNDNTGNYWLRDGSGNAKEMTPAGVATGNIIDDVSGIQNLTYNTTADTIWVRTSAGFREYDANSPYALTGRSFSQPTPTMDRGMTYDSISDTMWGISSSNRICYEFSLTGVLTGRQFTPTIAAQSAFGCVHIPSTNNIWVASSQNTSPRPMEEWSVDTLAATGQTITNVNGFVSNQPIGMCRSINNTFAIVIYTTGLLLFNASYEVGDSTARTSAMGDGQPLFLKIK